MRQSIHLALIVVVSIVIFFTNCDSPNTSSPKVTTTQAESMPIDWADALQKATSFKEETALLTTLIQVDSTNIYQQLVANRLQTFDLRHLKEKEKLTILELYESSLLATKRLSNTTLQIAHAKLKDAHPTKSTLANEKIAQLLALIEKQAGDGLFY